MFLSQISVLMIAFIRGIHYRYLPFNDFFDILKGDLYHLVVLYIYLGKNSPPPSEATLKGGSVANSRDNDYSKSSIMSYLLYGKRHQF